MSDVEATTPEPAQEQEQAEKTNEKERGGSEEAAESKPEAEKENIYPKFPEIVDDGKVWYYGRHTPTGPDCKRIVEVNPKNRHETQLYELGKGNYLGTMVYSQSKQHLLLF